MPTRASIAEQMFARSQIDRESLDAARRYQKAFTAAKAVPIERQLSRHFGADGVLLMRDVIGRGKTIERAARERGDDSKHGVAWWGSLFRRCLHQLADGPDRIGQRP